MRSDFIAKRVIRKSNIQINGAPEQVFPLLCPVRENDWVEGWEQISQLIYSESGYAEEGCVFTSHLPDEGYAVWVLTRYEPQNKYVEYLKIIPQKAAVHFKLRVTANQDRTSALEIIYVMTGLDGDGNQYIELIPARFANLLEKGLNHYLTTGMMLKAGNSPT